MRFFLRQLPTVILATSCLLSAPLFASTELSCKRILKPTALRSTPATYIEKRMLSLKANETLEGSAQYQGTQPNFYLDVNSPSFKPMKDFAKSLKRKNLPVWKKVEKIIKYINKEVFLNTSYDNPLTLQLANLYLLNKSDVPLSEYIKLKSGVCREHALLTYFMLKWSGIENRYFYFKEKMLNTGEIADHAVNIIVHKGEFYTVDSYLTDIYNGIKLNSLMTNKKIDPSDVAPYMQSKIKYGKQTVQWVNNFPNKIQYNKKEPGLVDLTSKVEISQKHLTIGKDIFTNQNKPVFLHIEARGHMSMQVGSYRLEGHVFGPVELIPNSNKLRKGLFIELKNLTEVEKNLLLDKFKKIEGKDSVSCSHEIMQILSEVLGVQHSLGNESAMVIKNLMFFLTNPSLKRMGDSNLGLEVHLASSSESLPDFINTLKNGESKTLMRTFKGMLLSESKLSKLDWWKIYRTIKNDPNAKHLDFFNYMDRYSQKELEALKSTLIDIIVNDKNNLFYNFLNNNGFIK